MKRRESRSLCWEVGALDTGYVLDGEDVVVGGGSAGEGFALHSSEWEGIKQLQHQQQQVSGRGSVRDTGGRGSAITY